MQNLIYQNRKSDFAQHPTFTKQKLGAWFTSTPKNFGVSPAKTGRGFTLIEMTVSLGLFAVVVMIGMGAFFAISDSNSKVQSMRLALDNLNLALESMSRDIRTGTAYHCDYAALPITARNDCPTGASSFSFLSQDGDQVVYQLNGSTIERSTTGGAIFTPLTAPDINVDYLTFYVLGSEYVAPYEFEQPVVVITVGGTAGTKIPSRFNIQTTVVQRIPKY